MKARTRTKRRITHRPAARAPRGAGDIERQLDALEHAGGDGELELAGGRLEVTHLTKVFFPRTGHTKGDLMRYYARVALALLPAIADRPLVMRRFPNGVRGQAFYQQKAPANAPEIVRIERVTDKGFTPADKIIGGDLATLLYVVQLGAISIDPWSLASARRAVRRLFDHRPGPRGSRVIRARRGGRARREGRAR